MTAGGRRSEPYAGSGPAGTAEPTAGVTGADIGALVTTVGATAAVPVSPAAITGVPAAVADVSTEGWIAADSIPVAAMVGAATGAGVGSGEAVCGPGVAPDSIACIVPADNDCAPAAAGCPVIMPVANDCPTEVGEMPCPAAAGEKDPPGRPGAAGMPGSIPGGVVGAGRVVGGPAGIGPLAAWPLALTTGRGDDVGASAPVKFPRLPPPLANPPSPATAGCGPGAPAFGASPGVPPTPVLRPPEATGDEVSSSLPMGHGGGTSSTLKPWSRAHDRASAPVPSASRIFCVAATILSTEARDAFAASALHCSWIMCISSSCSGSGFFELRIFSISRSPAFAISVSLPRK
ncbi:hypothetical protein LAUMK191_05513 [Mycobacterium attenuatum]|nr:hypothetical protein LAUMK191_05513 [Mycobacterium attenuatum]